MRGLLPEPGPVRPLALATLVNTVGNGLLMTVSVLYFTRIVGLSAGQVGLGLTVAGLFGLLAGVPMGHLADRRGPRAILVTLLVVLSGLQLLYLLVDSFWQFVLLSSVILVLDRGASAVRGALIAGVATDARGRVHARAYLRSVTNIGITAGAGIGALALAWDTAAAYRTMFVLQSVSTLGAALVLTRVPPVAPQPKPADGRRVAALRDRGFLAFCALNAAMCMHYALLDVALPLWVVGHTEAPRWTVAVLLAINTVMVALFQVRAARGLDDPAAAARATRSAGLMLLVALCVFAAASGGGPVVAVALLATGALIQAVAELLQSAGSFLLSFELADERAHGQYQGLWQTSMSIGVMAAPAVCALLPLGLGVPGWVILGVWFAVAGVAFVPVVRWAEMRRGVPVRVG